MQKQQEKATVAAIYALKTTDMNPEGIRKVYGLDAQSPMLDVLLGREMNKLEEDYFTNMLEEDANRQSYYWGRCTGGQISPFSRCSSCWTNWPKAEK